MNEIVNSYWPVINVCQKSIQNNQDLLIVHADYLLKTKKEFKNLNLNSYIYKNELDKACFQHDMTYVDFKDLKRRAFPDKVLRDKAFNIAKNPKYDGYQRGLASMVYKSFDKNSAGGGVNIPLEFNEQLAE